MMNHMGVTENVVYHPICIMFHGEKDDEAVDFLENSRSVWNGYGSAWLCQARIRISYVAVR